MVTLKWKMSWSPHGTGYYWRILPVLSRLFYQKITLLSFHIFSIHQEGTYFRHILTFLVKSHSVVLPSGILTFFLLFFDIRRICYIAPERFKTRTITVEAATNPTLSTSIISDETPEADGEGDGELLPSMDIFSGIKAKQFVSTFLHTWSKHTGSKWPWSTWQASSMHLRHETSLLSTPWQF